MCSRFTVMPMIILTKINYDPVYDRKQFGAVYVPTSVVMKRNMFWDLTFCSSV
jgi:hypothetical protein